MKTSALTLILVLAFAAWAEGQTPPGSPATDGTSAPPPSAAPRRSAADLEKLVAPIALYPDPLIATILPASVYPLEIVQAARFVADTNNLAKLDAQTWDDNVKAVARLPDVIKKLNDDLPWTMELGEAFLAQDKDLMDAIQTMRAKAQSLGTLKTSPQQVVTVTNVIIEKTVEQKVVVVTNTIVQIQPANPQVIFVPTYNPTVVYYPPPPAYVGPPPGLTFAAGMAMGAIIANNCDYYHGGCYHGSGNVNVNVNNNVNVNRNTTINQNVNANRNANVNQSANANRSASASGASAQQKWQPDQSRMSKSGSPSTSAASKQARGYSSGSSRPNTQASAANRASPSTGSAGARPSTGSTAARPSTGSSASRPSTSPSASQNRASPSASPSASRSSSSGGAFGGASRGSSAKADSSRGSSSRSSGGGRSGGRGR